MNFWPLTLSRKRRKLGLKQVDTVCYSVLLGSGMTYKHKVGRAVRDFRNTGRYII